MESVFEQIPAAASALILLAAVLSLAESALGSTLVLASARLSSWAEIAASELVPLRTSSPVPPSRLPEASPLGEDFVRVVHLPA